ncbi:TadE/TadG family type IV pilus assembly protein [Streptomyces rishiriensis]|uniref:Membrane protein n=1 Tax=Streptomyces humidus TaxID=52259 RepID=A0A918FUB1_9ACTN|nr:MULTISPECIES: TadE/TadG family type IV pilus assembly protein [Streptomyces]MBK3625705.1 pilus assembly protein [Streptomyces sp. MBT49]QUW85587.1 pilus assembly protein [Streptomyces mirabilis]GGR81568.1 membrane protein [Streptomyces humidus]
MSIAERLRDDRGALSLEAVILFPVLILVLLLVIAFGRIGSAGNAVDTAARNAARAASLERTGGAASSAGSQMARSVLDQQGLQCTSTSISVSTGGFSAQIGEPASTTATVTCVVRLSDIGLPGLPGSKTLTSSFTSSIDSYRQRG